MKELKLHKILYDPQTGGKLLTLKEAAAYLDYNPYSVYRLVSQGVLKPQKVGGKTLVFLLEELDRYRTTNEWAARKASIKHQPELDREKLPSTMTATVEFDVRPRFLVTSKKEHIENFSWEQIPLIRADLDKRYGKKLLSFEITVNSPDGWIWRINPDRYFRLF